ncbi:MAG: cysteine protease StiP family protein [Clostridia bacterium]|nr:cysteine protease StiP family protein [Clostridia bacterium]
MLPQNIIDVARQINHPDKMGSYSEDDVIFLLKDISRSISEQGNEEREQKIQSGTHYSEMLPIEYQPKEEYLEVFHQTLESTAAKIAAAAGIVSHQIMKTRGPDTVLVSLARAGTPIGILIKRYIQYKYKLNLPHYSISIIRDKGIDENALLWILNNHPGKNLQFIDGWTGKGVINGVLLKACNDFYHKYGISLNPDLAVLADPAGCVKTFGTREDFLIPSACLNSTVSGLVSRTVLREDLIGRWDFHGAKYYAEWKDIDLSNYFLDKITGCFSLEIPSYDLDPPILNVGLRDVLKIQEDLNIPDINLIKPGVGETTRVLLRRVPWKILIDRTDNPNLKHILILARDRGVPVEVYKEMNFSCCGLIQSKNGKKLVVE